MLLRCSECGVHCPVCQFFSGIPEAWNLFQSFNAFLSGLVLSDCLDDIRQIRLGFTDVNEIEELCKRKRIGRCRSSCKYYGITLFPVLGLNRDMSQFKYLKYVCCTEFIADGDSEIIHLIEWKMLLQSKQRDILLPQHCLEIRCDSKDPVAEGSFCAVDYVIQDTYGIVGHSDLVEVGKAHGAFDIALSVWFSVVDELAAQIARRVLYFKESVSQTLLQIYYSTGIVVLHFSLFASSSSSGLRL